VEEEWVFEEPGLHVEFEEDMQLLLEVNELEGVATGDVDGAFDHCYCAESSTELVYL
jgi:hypothetical protein